MKPADVFGIALRLVGLYLLIDATPKLVSGLLSVSELGVGYVVRKAIGVGFGVYFLSGARAVQRFAYPEQGGASKGGPNV